MYSKKNSKKGFTLMELSVVLAVTAIVVTMVSGFMIAYQQQSTKFTKNSDAMSDINELKSTISQWIDENDDGKTAFTVSSNKITMGSNSISFSSGELKVNGTAHKFETLSGCEFSKRDSIENVIYCDATVKIGSKENKIELMFDVHYGASRKRS